MLEKQARCGWKFQWWPAGNCPFTFENGWKKHGKKNTISLGGGNSNIFRFHPKNWGRWTQFDGSHIFQMGGKKPPTRPNGWGHRSSNIPTTWAKILARRDFRQVLFTVGVHWWNNQHGFLHKIQVVEWFDMNLEVGCIVEMLIYKFTNCLFQVT